MLKKNLTLLFLLLVLFVSTLTAEIITLKNGDAIEGTILTMNSDVVRMEDSNGIILEVKKDMIASIDYSNGNEYPEENNRQMSSIPNAYQPVQNSPMPEAVPVSPINPYPMVHYDPAPFESGLLDPELEARRRMVSYNEQRKNPLLATSLSIVFPGTGHFYCNKIASGFFFLGTRTIFAGMTWYGFTQKTDPNTDKTSYNDVVIGSAGVVGFVTMMIIEAMDSYSAASDYNNNLRLKLGIDTLHEKTVPIFEEPY